MPLLPAENKLRAVAYGAQIEQRRHEILADITRVLPPSGRIVLEIGCGHGHFLVAYAAMHPDSVCVGLDIASDRVARAVRKRDRAKLHNLHFFHTDAGLFLEVLPRTLLLLAIYLLFPDPWPKQRHHKHRVVQTAFLTKLADRSGQGTPLFFRTDHRPYFEDAQSTIRRHPKWQLVSEPWPFEHSTVFQNRAADYQSLVARLRTA